MISKEEILRRGYVDVKVFVSGLRQSHRMEVVREKTSQGMVPFLVSKHYIPTAELVRLAEELQLPVKHRDIAVFPKGKMAGHFTEKIKKEVVATVESDTVEAEVESEE
ncbi:hypothetical protein H0O00_01455 [Candidatus Micrarchaeota archaeon]|nr:hypothetical protein [Candidatus Micrarchaeota archaeon]